MKNLIVVVILLASFNAAALEINPSHKWNGIGSHPAKKLQYLESNDFGKCKYIGFTYNYLKHSPKVPSILSAFCIITLEEGKGVNKKKVCTILDIDWNGKHHPSYIKEGPIAELGPCNQDTISKLKVSIEKHAKKMNENLSGTKLHILKDIFSGSSPESSSNGDKEFQKTYKSMVSSVCTKRKKWNYLNAFEVCAGKYEISKQVCGLNEKTKNNYLNLITQFPTIAKKFNLSKTSFNPSICK